MLQQTSQKVSGDISRNRERNRQLRDRNSKAAIPIISTLQARICAIDAANKKEAAAADELFHQSGQRIRTSQLPRKILAETECLRLPT